MPAGLQRAKAVLAEQIARHEVLDHVVRTVAHYGAMQGRNLAGAVSYFAFLSLFPLIAIGYAATSCVVGVYPDAEEALSGWLAANLPGLTGPDGLDVEAIAAGGAERLGAGVAGAAGLVYSGLGALDALRASLRRMWAVAPVDANIVVKKASDLLVLLLLGTTVLLATATSALTTAFTDQVLDLLGVASTTWAAVGVRALAIALAVLADTGVLLVVFARLPGHRLPWRNTWTGALIGALGAEVLKQLATVLLSGTSSNPVYGAFAGLVTVLVWINLVCRVVMYAAAWVVTGPVPTVEAELAARGERLDAATADAVGQAREEHDGRAEAAVAALHRTTAGAVALTTTSIDAVEDDPTDRPGRRAPGFAAGRRERPVPEGSRTGVRRSAAVLFAAVVLVAARTRARRGRARAPGGTGTARR